MDEISHLLAQTRDIPRSLDDTLPTVMVLIEFISELLKHGSVGIFHNLLRGRPGPVPPLCISIPVSLEAGHFANRFFFGCGCW